MNRSGTPRNLLPFKKGRSGNPRGRPKEPWKAWLCGEPEDAARRLVLQLLPDRRVKIETRLRAAQ